MVPLIDDVRAADSLIKCLFFSMAIEEKTGPWFVYPRADRQKSKAVTNDECNGAECPTPKTFCKSRMNAGIGSSLHLDR